MNTQSITIDLPFDILQSLNKNEAEIKEDIKLSLALHLYLLGELTIGRAAELSGLSLFEFETFLSKNQIPISLISSEQILKESRQLK